MIVTTEIVALLAATFSESASRLEMKRGQKSLKRGRSIFLRVSLVLASTLTYSWVTGRRDLGVCVVWEGYGCVGWGGWRYVYMCGFLKNEKIMACFK